MKLLNDTPYVAELARAQLPYRNLTLAIVVAKASFEVDKRGVVVPVTSDPVAISEADVVTPLGTIDGDIVPIKLGCDFAFFGHARAPESRLVPRLIVELQIGEFKRRLAVFGNRSWQRRGQSWVASEPELFASLPLTYEHAFGGTSSAGDFDTSYADNPDGKGFVQLTEQIEGTSLPNLEEIDQLIVSPADRPLPAGLAPLPRNCVMRLARGAVANLEEGTTRLLPSVFSMAHPRMMLDRYPADQELRLRGMTLADPWTFRLPELELHVEVMLGERSQQLPMSVDTVCVFPDYRRFYVVARRAFIYRVVPRQHRLTRVALGTPSEASVPGSIRQLAPAQTAEIATFDPASHTVLPFELLRDLNPMTEILEDLPLCLVG